MKSLKLFATTALAAAAICSVAWAQGLPDGRVYTFHSKAQAGCPALDWHVVAGANGTLSGMIAWDDMKAMAHATGTVNMQSHTFQMTAKEVGGQGRTATVDGSVRQDGWLIANIKGPKIACTGITVPWFTPGQAAGGNG
jgi:hypothetical protein